MQNLTIGKSLTLKMLKSVKLLESPFGERQKSHDYINRYGKTIWLGTAPIYDKHTQQSGSRGNIPQHNKGHIQEAYCQHHTQWGKN